MKSKKQNPFLLAAITLAGFALTAPKAFAADLTWDTVPGDGATITAGGGIWDTSTTAWNDAGSDVVWSQTSATSGSNTATFAGADGTVDQYVVTLGEAVAAQSITFNNSGNRIAGSTLALTNGAANGAITVAAGKTATINSILRYNHNVATPATINAGSVLNLGGGTTASFNPQLNLSGAGTVNFTGGTFTSNIANVNVAAVNLTGGTYRYTPGNNAGVTIGATAGQNVNYTVSGAGTLTVNNNATSGTGTPPTFLRIGSSTTIDYEAALTVQTGGTVTIGSGKAGELQIAGTGASNGTLDVQDGTVTVANGTTSNKIYLFKAGASAGFAATMTQSGGNVTANGIQFGGTTGTYDLTSAASLTLSGGNLYVGLQGITRGSVATDLPVNIKLQAGTLGASAAWSSPLDMKLGTATIQAANSGGAAQNITLSGILSNDGAVNGTLTKTGAGTLTLGGANEFTGATAVNQGTLVLANPDAASTSSSLTIADAAALSLTTTSSTVNNLTFTNTGTLNFNVDGGGTDLTVSDSNGVTNSGAAGSITINVTGAAPATGTYTLISYTGSLQGSGFSAYKLGTTPAGKSYSLFNGAGAVQLVVTDPSLWTGAQSSEWSTNVIAGSKNWTISASPADYVNGVAVIFDESATNKTVDISVADVTPASVQFNSTSTYTLQGSNSIAGPAPVTVTAGTLKLGSANVLPDGSGTGTVTIDGTLDLNGFSDTINGLSGTGSGVVDNTAVGSATLTVGNGNGSGTIFSTIQNTVGSLGIVKVGSGQLFLRGNSSFTGGVLVTSGTLNGGSSPNAIGTGGVTLGGSGSTGAAFIGGQDFSANVNVTVNPPDSGNCVIGANGAGSGMVIGSITLNSADVTVDTVGGGTTAATTVKGGVTGTGNLLLNNRSTTVGNRVIFSAATVVNHTGTITSQGTGTTSNFIGADIGSNVTGVIQNSATALLVLNGINSYTGNTTVNAGILRINNASDPANANPNNDASTVSIASGAQMNLQYTGTDIVDKLFFGPTQQPMGEYSSSSVPDGATITTASFLGGGTLTVSSSPGGSGYSDWATLNGAGPNLNDDHDNDGVDNGVEYFIGGPSGDTTGFTPLPGVTNTAGTLSVTWTKAAGYTGTYGTDFVVQTSSTLSGTWTNEILSPAPGFTVVITGNDVKYTFPAGTKNFARLKVTGP